MSKVLALHKDVAQDLGLEYTPLSQLLA